MLKKEFLVRNKLGLHARVAGILVRCLMGYDCKVTAVKNGKRHNLKSVMDVMLMATKQGETIWAEFDGNDEQEAALAVEKLFRSAFEEC